MSNTNETEVLLPESTEEFNQIVERASHGDAEVLPVIRKLVRDWPAFAPTYGANLNETVEQSFIEKLGGENLAFAESLKWKLKGMRTELAGPSVSPVEQLLVDRVVACWLQVQDADIRYAQSPTDCTFAQGEYHQRRQDRANRRFLSAIKALATVRKLALPALQVNIGQNQVNTVSSGE